jgi:hypothetical protein
MSIRTSFISLSCKQPHHFAGRYRALAQKVMCNSEDPTSQRVHSELTYRMFLASFICVLSCQPAKQVRYANPQTFSEALRIAPTVKEAEKQEIRRKLLLEIRLNGTLAVAFPRTCADHRRITLFF